jgi:adenosylhomocysteine nucleosidase
MRILVTFAVEAEFAPWRRLRNLEESKIGEVTLHKTQIGRAQVDLVVTGMGMENAGRVAEKVIAATTPYQFCVSAGFAGGLGDEYSIGDILVAEAVQQLGKSKTLMCSRNLVHAARSDGAKQVKLFLTSDHVVRTVEEKSRLAPFAGAVEMESFAVASVTRVHNLSMVAIRVISDTTDRDMPVRVDTMVDEKGRLSVGGVMRQVVHHPLQLPALIRLGRESRTAAEALANFLEAFIKKLSFSSHGWPPPELQEVAAQ